MKTLNWNNGLGSAEYVNVFDLSDKEIKKLIKNNYEYLTWNDGSMISKKSLQADFVLLKENGLFSLTMRNENFYINDIDF